MMGFLDFFKKKDLPHEEKIMAIYVGRAIIDAKNFGYSEEKKQEEIEKAKVKAIEKIKEDRIRWKEEVVPKLREEWERKEEIHRLEKEIRDKMLIKKLRQSSRLLDDEIERKTWVSGHWRRI